MTTTISSTARVLKALADPVRLRMLQLMANPRPCLDADCCNLAISRPPGVCTCELVDVLQMPQPTVTYHLKLLHEADLVDSESHGRWTFYSVKHDTVRHYVQAVITLTTPGGTRHD